MTQFGYNFYLCIVLILLSVFSFGQPGIRFINPIDSKFIDTVFVDTSGKEIIKVIVPGSPPKTGYSYPNSSPQEAMILFKPLIDQNTLKKVMDESGKTIENFAGFGGWQNNIGNLIPGKGYKVNVTSNCTLNIP